MRRLLVCDILERVPTRSFAERDLVLAATGELEFSACWGALAAYPPGATWGPRTLRTFELVWILEGSASWTCNGVRHEAGPNTLILSRPGNREHYCWDPMKQTRHAFVHFEIRRGLHRLPPQSKWPELCQLPEGDVVRPVFRHLLWALHQTPALVVPAQTSLRHILFALLTDNVGTSSPAGSELPSSVEKALSWALGRMKKNPHASHSLAELAKAAGTSPRQLHRDFKAAFERGPVETLRQVRLDRAAFLLSSSNLEVQEVADRTGFKNAFHFSRSFKSAFGYPPSVLRVRLERGEDIPPPAIRRNSFRTRVLLDW